MTKALTASERSSCVVTTGEAIPLALLSDMRTAYTDIFNGKRVTESTDGTEQFNLLKGELERQVVISNVKVITAHFHGRHLKTPLRMDGRASGTPRPCLRRQRKTP